MKHLKRIFESNEDYRKYIEECFLDVLENPNFEVDDLIEVDANFGMNSTSTTRIIDLMKDSGSNSISIYKLHIEEGDSIKIKAPSGTNSEIGKRKVDINFLKMRVEKISELIEDIETAINRIEEKFTNSENQIYINKRNEIDVVIIIKNN